MDLMKIWKWLKGLNKETLIVIIFVLAGFGYLSYKLNEKKETVINTQLSDIQFLKGYVVNVLPAKISEKCTKENIATRNIMVGLIRQERAHTNDQIRILIDNIKVSNKQLLKEVILRERYDELPMKKDSAINITYEPIKKIRPNLYDSCSIASLNGYIPYDYIRDDFVVIDSSVYKKETGLKKLINKILGL